MARIDEILLTRLIVRPLQTLSVSAFLRGRALADSLSFGKIDNEVSSRWARATLDTRWTLQ